MRSPGWPNRRIKPPYGAAKINWSHPLARGLVAYYLLNEGAPGAITSLVTPQQFTGYGTVAAPTFREGLAPNGAWWATTTDRATTLITGHPFSVVGACRINSNVTTAYLFGLGDALAAPYVYLGRSGSTYNRTAIRINLGTALASLSGSTNAWTDFGWHTIGLTSAATNSHLGYLDGGQSGSTTTTDAGTNYSFASAEIGNSRPTAGGNPWDGDIRWVGVWNGRALTAAEHRLLHADPYALLEPVRERSYGWKSVAAGGESIPPLVVLRRDFWKTHLCR